MWLTLKNNNDHNNKDYGHFNGKILLADTFCLHEIYNPKKLDSLYTDLSTRKRKRRDCISQHADFPSTNEEVEDDAVVSKHTDLPSTHEEIVLEDDSVVSEHTDLPSTNENNAVVSEKTNLPLNDKEMQDSVGPGRISLPVMGPKGGMLAMSLFHAILHQDSGDPEIEESFFNRANESIYGWHYTLEDEDVLQSCEMGYVGYDRNFSLSVECSLGLVTLDCIVYSTSKVVHLEVQWLKPNKNATDDPTDDAMDDCFLRGSLTVTNDIYKEDIVSVLLDTPPNRAVMAKPGVPIPLLKSVVSVPFDSSFTVNADLQYSNNTHSDFNPIVKGEAMFSVENEDLDSRTSTFAYSNLDRQWCQFYESTKCIKGRYGGEVRVMARVMRTPF